MTRRSTTTQARLAPRPAAALLLLLALLAVAPLAAAHDWWLEPLASPAVAHHPVEFANVDL